MPHYRKIYLLLTAALAVVVVAALLLSVSGDETQVPAPLESIFPAPGDTVVRQTIIEVDLPVGYSMDLYVDGEWVPADEIGFTRSTGVYLWQPSPGGSMEIWETGEHIIRVVWDRTAGGRPDPGEYEWVFRVQ